MDKIQPYDQVSYMWNNWCSLWYKNMYQDIDPLIKLNLISQITKFLVISWELFQSVKESTPSNPINLWIGHWSSATSLGLTSNKWILTEATTLPNLCDDNIISVVLIYVDKQFCFPLINKVKRAVIIVIFVGAIIIQEECLSLSVMDFLNVLWEFPYKLKWEVILEPWYRE